MHNDENERKPIPESRIALIAAAILLGALVLYALNLLLPGNEPDPASPTKTPVSTPITDENGLPAPIDCYVWDIAGNSALLLSADGKSAVIDAGYAVDAPKVIESLRLHNVRKLDLAFLTCADDYAIGGMREVLEAFPVDAFYVSAHLVSDRSVSELCAFLADKGTAVHAVNADFVSTVDWAVNAELRILSPYNAEYTEPADNALVLRLNYGSCGITFLGSAGALAERMMVKALPNRLLHTDILFLTDTGRTEAPYEKYFKVSKASTYVLKSYRADTVSPSSLEQFLAGTKLIPLVPAGGLHLILDGAAVRGVE